MTTGWARGEASVTVPWAIINREKASKPSRLSGLVAMAAYAPTQSERAGRSAEHLHILRRDLHPP